MTRETATFVFCAGPGCKVAVKVLDTTEAPEGWYRIDGARDGKYNFREPWEFHSLTCIKKWAQLRKEALEGKKFSRSSGPDSRPVGKIEEIMTAFNIDVETSLSIPEIIQLTGVEKTAVYKTIKELLNNGVIEQTEKSRGTVPARYRLKEGMQVGTSE